MKPSWPCSFAAAAIALSTGLCPAPATGAAGPAFSVAPWGKDTNPGTLELPWKTIGKAAATLRPGETVSVRAGRYRERVVPQRSGEPERFITFAAFPGEEVVIDGAGIPVPRDEGLVNIVDLAWIQVRGFLIVDSAEAGILADRSQHLAIEGNRTERTGCSGIGVWGCREVLVDGNEVALSCSGGWQEGISIAGTEGFEVRRNHVYNGPPGYPKEGICAKDGSSRGTVHHNHVHHVRAVGIYVDAWDKTTSDIEVFANDVHDVLGSDGIALASEMGGMLQRVRVFNNIVWRNRFCGISITRNGDSARHPMADIAIVNNTVWGNGTREWGGGILVDDPDIRSGVIRNNICAGNLTFEIADESSPPGSLLIEGNLLDELHDVPEERPGAGPVYGDPRFVDPKAGDFRLLPGSPAIDAGSPAGSPAEDRFGAKRPQGRGVDIGAVEFAAPPVP